MEATGGRYAESEFRKLLGTMTAKVRITAVGAAAD